MSSSGSPCRAREYLVVLDGGQDQRVNRRFLRLLPQHGGDLDIGWISRDRATVPTCPFLLHINNSFGIPRC